MVYVNSTLPVHPTLPFLHSVHTSIPYICVSIPALGLCFKRGETTNQPPVYKLVLNAMKERKAEKGSREYCVGLGFQFL